MQESYGFQGTYFLQQLMLGPTVSEQLALDPFGSVIRSLVAGGLGVAGPPFGGGWWWMRLVSELFEVLDGCTVYNWYSDIYIYGYIASEW